MLGNDDVPLLLLALLCLPSVLFQTAYYPDKFPFGEIGAAGFCKIPPGLHLEVERLLCNLFFLVPEISVGCNRKVADTRAVLRDIDFRVTGEIPLRRNLMLH